MNKEFTPEQEARRYVLDAEDAEIHRKLMFVLQKVRDILKQHRAIPHELKKELKFLSEERDRISKKILDFLNSIS